MKNVFAVVVAYNPVLENLQALVAALSAQGVRVVLLDNDSDVSFVLDNCHKIRLGRNLGIAYAQNLGVSYCAASGADVVLFFDQDSSIGEGFVEALLEPIASGRSKIAVPILIDDGKGFYYNGVRVSPFGLRRIIDLSVIDCEVETNIAVSSGMAVAIDVFDRVGGMVDGLFIDYVDTEWCLRCSAAGLGIIISPRAKMRHSIGDGSFRFLGRRILVHSPARRYYRVRNAFLLLRMPWVPKLLVLREICVALVHQFGLMILFPGSSLDYARYYFLGVWHGVRDRRGPLI